MRVSATRRCAARRAAKHVDAFVRQAEAGTLNLHHETVESLKAVADGLRRVKKAKAPEGAAW